MSDLTLPRDCTAQQKRYAYFIMKHLPLSSYLLLLLILLLYTQLKQCPLCQFQNEVVTEAVAAVRGSSRRALNVGNAAEHLNISDEKVRAHYKEQMQQTGLPICSLMMGLLNSNPLATDPLGPAWLEQSIDAAKDLGARVILVAFFGKGDLLDADGKVKEADVDEVVKRLKAAAPRAKESTRSRARLFLV